MRENSHTSVVCIITLIKYDKVLNLKLFFKRWMCIPCMSHILYKEDFTYNYKIIYVSLQKPDQYIKKCSPFKLDILEPAGNKKYIDNDWFLSMEIHYGKNHLFF